MSILGEIPRFKRLFARTIMLQCMRNRIHFVTQRQSPMVRPLLHR